MPIFIGTAGYVYPHWREGRFYPSSTPQSSELSYYLSRFPSVEINATWHAFPRASTLSKWRASAPPSTCLALKAPKLITHTKRLVAASDDIRSFLRVAADGLAHHLGPVLFQCPPSLSLSMALLEAFVADVDAAKEESPVHLRVALEFRNRDWFCPHVFELLARHDIALVNNIVVQDNDFSKLDDLALPHCRQANVPTASWSYNRFHGSKTPGVTTEFPDVVLRRFAKLAAAATKESPKYAEYSFFLNDLDAVAPKSAKRYAQLVAEEAGINVKHLFQGFVPEWARKKKDITSFFKPTSPKATPLDPKSTLPSNSYKGAPLGKVGKGVGVRKLSMLSPSNRALKPKKSPMKKETSQNSKAKDIASFFTSQGGNE